MYVAIAGATAADGEGTNSPFSQALAKRLPQPALTTGKTSESMFWQSALKMNNESACRSYLAKYPNGQFVGLAYGCIQKIVQPKALRANLGIIISDVD